MSRVTRTSAARHAALGFALAGFAVSFIADANAGDLYAPAYSPYPLAAPAPVYERTIERERYFAAAPAFHGRVAIDNGPCRIVLKRRIDAWGRELVHRIRVCDDGPVYGAPNGPVYGAPNGPVYGVPNGPAYGVPNGPVYGVPNGPVYGVPNGPVVLPENGYGPRRYYEPSGYYGFPRPPVAVGLDYYN
jgi:hypothetical protein